MFTVFARVTVTIFGIAVILTLGARVVGQQFNEFPGLSIQRDLGNSRDVVYIDHESNIQFTLKHREAVNPTYRVSPDGTMGFYILFANNHPYVYVQSTNDKDPKFLGTYDFPFHYSLITWSADSRYLFIMRNLPQDNFELWQLDITDGTRSLFDTYDFSYPPLDMFRLNDRYIFISGTRDFLLIDEIVHQQHLYSTTTYPHVSPDRQYIAFSTTSDDLDGDSFTILNVETFAETHVTANRPDTFMIWSPALLEMAFMDGDHIVVYNVETGIQYDLSPDYRFPGAMNTVWSNDGTRLILTKRLGEDQIAYLAVNIQTGEETILFIDQIPYTRPSALAWSQNDRYILSYLNAINKYLTYQVYNGETGALLYDIDTDPDKKIKTQLINWLQ